MPLLLLAFLIVPLVELWVIIQVGQVLGAGWTILLLLAVSVLGAALVKREGLRAWQRFRRTLNSGRLPTDEVIDGALVLLAGALMLTPGFVTDAVGVILLIPVTRAVVRRALRSRVRTSLAFTVIGGGRGRPRSRPAGTRPDGARPRDPDAIDVEVVRVERHGVGDRDSSGRG